MTEEGIIVVELKPKAKQTLELAKSNILLCQEVSQGQRKPLLIDMRVAEPITPDIRHYYSSKEVEGLFIAMALVVESSSFGRAMGNFYLQVSKRGVNKKLFIDPAKGMTWLQTLL